MTKHHHSSIQTCITDCNITCAYSLPIYPPKTSIFAMCSTYDLCCAAHIPPHLLVLLLATRLASFGFIMRHFVAARVWGQVIFYSMQIPDASATTIVLTFNPHLAVMGCSLFEISLCLMYFQHTYLAHLSRTSKFGSPT